MRCDAAAAARQSPRRPAANSGGQPGNGSDPLAEPAPPAQQVGPLPLAPGAGGARGQQSAIGRAATAGRPVSQASSIPAISAGTSS